MSSDLASSAEFRAILNGSLDPIGIVDARGRFTWINDAVALFFGFESDQLIGTHFRDYLALDEQPGDAMRRAQMGHPAAVVRRIRRTDGSTAVLRTELIPVGDHGDVLIHGTDLTALYEAVDRAEASGGRTVEAARDLERLLGEAAGHLDRAEAALPADAAAAEALQAARQAIERARTLGG